MRSVDMRKSDGVKAGTAADVPSVIRVSFWAWVAAAAVGLIDAVLFFYFKDALVDSTIKARPDLNVDQVRSGATAYVWLTLILAVLFGSLYVYLGYKMRDGARRQRTWLLVAGLVHLAISILFPISLVVLVGVVLSLIGALAMYLPAAAKTYFTNEV